MKPAPLLFDDRLPDRAPSSRAGWRRGVLWVVLIFLATRLVTWTCAYYGAELVYRIEERLPPPYQRHLYRLATQPAAPEHATRRQLLGDFMPLCRFDAIHYRSIIERGYSYTPPPPPEQIRSRTEVEQNIAFFPLYPALVRPLRGVLSINAAQVLVAHLAALAAALVLYAWIRWRIDEPTALLAVAATFCWPTACYFSFGYAESVTLLTVTGALALIDRGRFGWAAVASGLATATRPTALAIVAVYALAWWQRSPQRPALRLAGLLPRLLLAAGGLLSYAVYLAYRFGSPLVYFDNFRAGWVTDRQRADWFEFLVLARVWDQFKYFGRLLRNFPEGMVNAANPLMWNMPLNFFVLFLSLAAWGRVPRSFRPLLLLGPLVFLHAYVAAGGATFGVEPIGRYLAVSVPAFVVLAAWWTREWAGGARAALLAFLLLVQAAWALRFGLREWCG